MFLFSVIKPILLLFDSMITLFLYSDVVLNIIYLPNIRDGSDNSVFVRFIPMTLFPVAVIVF